MIKHSVTREVLAVGSARCSTAAVRQLLTEYEAL